MSHDSPPLTPAPPQDEAGEALRSIAWLDSECSKAAASGAAVASQRRQGCGDSSQAWNQNSLPLSPADDPNREADSSPRGPFTSAGDSKTYKTILADPPWEQSMMGKRTRARDPRITPRLPYPTLSVEEICAMPVDRFAAPGSHLWLWTTNEFLEAGFTVMRAWGFRYLAPVTWIKPSGVGAWFVHRTQTLLFGYRAPLTMSERYKPTVIEANPRAHSAKPEESYRYIEAVSEGPRLEIFARPWTPLFEKRDGWDVWGNEVTPAVAGMLDVEYHTSADEAERDGWQRAYVGNHGRVYARRVGNHRIFRATKRRVEVMAEVASAAATVTPQGRGSRNTTEQESND